MTKKTCFFFIAERKYLRAPTQSTIKRGKYQTGLDISELNEQREEKSNVFELSRVASEEDR